MDLQTLDGGVGGVAETAKFASSILLLLAELCDALIGRVSLVAGGRLGKDEAERVSEIRSKRGVLLMGKDRVEKALTRRDFLKSLFGKGEG